MAEIHTLDNFLFLALEKHLVRRGCSRNQQIVSVKLTKYTELYQALIIHSTQRISYLFITNMYTLLKQWLSLFSIKMLLFISDF